MDPVYERFVFFVVAAQARNAKQFRFSLLVAVVIAVLLWQTQWLSLRPGLLILLLGQIAVAVAYFYRSRAKPAPAEARVSMLAWFASEQQYVKWSALGESGVRIIGFVILAYGFWISTRILWITLLLGVAYPVISYFGVARRSTRQTLRTLENQQQEILY